jgi:putative oxidoreductase
MDRLAAVQKHILGLFRIVVGFLFFCHGAKSVFGLFGAKSAVALGAWPGWWAAAIQLAGGALVCIGLGTRYAALVCSGSMAYAYFTVHQVSGLLPITNNGESAAMFCWAFLIIVFTGPGRFAVDNLFKAHGEIEAPRAVSLGHPSA